MSGQKSSKLPSEYTVEELLEATTVEGDTKVDPSNPITSSEVYTFINIFKLAPGPYLVRTSLLYKLYKAWSKKPMKKMEFGIRFTEIISKNESESIHRLNRHSRELIELPIQYQARNNTTARFRTVFPRFQEYLNHYNIKQGTYFIECYVLYQLYIMFKPGKSLSYKTFHKLCELYFKRERLLNTSISMFGVHEDIKQYLSQDVLDKATEWSRKRNETKRKKHKKKNSQETEAQNNQETSEVSSSESSNEPKKS